jgi:hypothetical protein
MEREAQVTPAGWPAALRGLVALVLGSAVVTLLAPLVRRWMDQHQRVRS